MDQRLLLALLISGLWSPSSARFRYFYLVTEQKTWVEARSYCRQQYTDLATVANMTEMEQLKGLIPAGFNKSIWIGLSRTTRTHWGWSSGDPLQYTNWNPGEPNGGDIVGLCGGMFRSGGWVDLLCGSTLRFICYSESPRTFVLVDISDTWRNAQSYCRRHYTDLATIHNKQEHQDVWNLLSSDQEMVWIGLFSNYFVWSNGQKISFHNWNSSQPAAGDCTAVSTTWFGYWHTKGCDVLTPFMCYKDPKKRLIRLKLTSDGEKDLNDPTVMTTIHAQIEQTLRRQGVGPDTTVSWRKIKGKIFNPEKIKEEQQKCSSPTPVIN